jgi:hypothetical protein
MDDEVQFCLTVFKSVSPDRRVQQEKYEDADDGTDFIDRK